MDFRGIPLRTIGPGTQPEEADGRILSYIDMPKDMFDLPEKALDSFINDAVKIIKALDKVIEPATTNLEYLDNWDFHVHWNVYPRFKTDPDYGNPPVIPPKGSKFKEYKMTKKEMAAFKKEIKKIKHLW